MVKRLSESVPEFRTKVSSRTWQSTFQSWCVSLCLGPLGLPFYYFRSTRVIIPDFPPFMFQLTLGTFYDVSCDHIQCPRWLFWFGFFFILCLDSAHVLIDCTYHGLVVPNVQKSTSMLFLCVFLKKTFKQAFKGLSIAPTLYKSVFFHAVLVVYSCLITDHLTLWSSFCMRC